jgi:hypothetical protein
MSHAILLKVGYRVPATFHQSKTLKLFVCMLTISSSKYRVSFVGILVYGSESTDWLAVMAPSLWDVGEGQ